MIFLIVWDTILVHATQDFSTPTPQSTEDGYTLTISSNPSGAKVSIGPSYMIYQGTTPIQVPHLKKQVYTIQIKLEGYQLIEERIDINSDVSRNYDLKSIEEQAWEEAQTINTFPAYEAFLQKYPKGVFALEARKQIERLFKDNEDDGMMYLVTKACQGQPSPYTDIVAVSDKRAAMIQDRTIVISSFLKAKTPQELYYAVCVTKEFHEVNRCKYTPQGEIIQQQINLDIEIREIRTGKKVDSIGLYSNASPSPCPITMSFLPGQLTIIQTTEPSSDQVIKVTNWINEVLLKQTQKN